MITFYRTPSHCPRTPNQVGRLPIQNLRHDSFPINSRDTVPAAIRFQANNKLNSGEKRRRGFGESISCPSKARPISSGDKTSPLLGETRRGVLAESFSSLWLPFSSLSLSLPPPFSLLRSRFSVLPLFFLALCFLCCTPLDRFSSSHER